MRRTTRLRQLVTRPEIAFLMEAHDGLSARIVQEAGFEGIWASGLTVSASFGVRDNNELSWTQVVDHVAFMAEAAEVPVLLDGDGNLLMNLGILPMIAAQRPPGLLHLVFDNEVYGSTGNQASPSRAVRLDRVAGAAGFASAVAVSEPLGLETALRAALVAPGPHFVLVKVTAEEAEVPRIPYTPAALRERFRAAVQEA